MCTPTHQEFIRTYAQFRDPAEMMGKYTLYHDMATLAGKGLILTIRKIDRNGSFISWCKRHSFFSCFVQSIQSIETKYKSETAARDIDKRDVNRWINSEQNHLANILQNKNSRKECLVQLAPPTYQLLESSDSDQYPESIQNDFDFEIL